MSCKTIIMGSAILAASLNAHADKTWTGEGSLSAGLTTGNTDTSDLGISVNAERDTGVWSYGAELSVDYGETDDVETRDRYFLASYLDRELSDRVFAFTRGSHEVDEFSGFESRTFVGGGLGYKVLNGNVTSWIIRAGPGYKIDEIRRQIDPLTMAVITVAATEKSVSGIGRSNFNHAFNDAVAFGNDTSILYAEESTQVENISAITADLTDAFSARLSFEVRHDTNPPIGFESTDTATRASLVYGF